MLALSRCNESRFLGSGPEEFQRVCNASIRVTALIALVAYATKAEVARGFVAIALPLGALLLLLLLLIGPLLARVWLHRGRRQGRYSHRVLLLGSYTDVQDLALELRREPLSGLQVVGACVPARSSRVTPPIPVFGPLDVVHDAVVAAGADTFAVTASPGLQGEALRRLSYDLEGTGSTCWSRRR